MGPGAHHIAGVTCFENIIILHGAPWSFCWCWCGLHGGFVDLIIAIESPWVSYQQNLHGGTMQNGCILNTCMSSLQGTMCYCLRSWACVVILVCATGCVHCTFIAHQICLSCWMGKQQSLEDTSCQVQYKEAGCSAVWLSCRHEAGLSFERLCASLRGGA